MEENGLKIRFPSGSGGSNPSAGTTYPYPLCGLAPPPVMVRHTGRMRAMLAASRKSAREHRSRRRAPQNRMGTPGTVFPGYP